MTLTLQSPNLPVLCQYIPLPPRILAIREEPDIPDNVHRSTENAALRKIAMMARCRERAGRRADLSGIHMELLRLERGAMQYLPQLMYDERIEFIIAAAHLRNVSPRQVEALLEQASAIIMLRDLRGISTVIDDLNEGQVKRLYRSSASVRVRPVRVSGKRGDIGQRAPAA